MQVSSVDKHHREGESVACTRVGGLLFRHPSLLGVIRSHGV